MASKVVSSALAGHTVVVFSKVRQASAPVGFRAGQGPSTARRPALCFPAFGCPRVWGVSRNEANDHHPSTIHLVTCFCLVAYF